MWIVGDCSHVHGESHFMDDQDTHEMNVAFNKILQPRLYIYIYHQNEALIIYKPAITTKGDNCQ